MGAGAFLVQQLNADVSLMVVTEHVSPDNYWEESVFLGQMEEMMKEIDIVRRRLI